MCFYLYKHCTYRVHVNDSASNSDHSGVSYRVFTLYSHKVSILVANVYVNNLEEWLLPGALLPCYKKPKSCSFFKRLEALSIEFKCYKI